VYILLRAFEHHCEYVAEYADALKGIADAATGREAQRAQSLLEGK